MPSLAGGMIAATIAATPQACSYIVFDMEGSIAAVTGLWRAVNKVQA